MILESVIDQKLRPSLTRLHCQARRHIEARLHQSQPENSAE
jgi:hypothetical protein